MKTTAPKRTKRKETTDPRITRLRRERDRCRDHVRALARFADEFAETTARQRDAIEEAIGGLGPGGDDTLSAIRRVVAERDDLRRRLTRMTDAADANLRGATEASEQLCTVTAERDDARRGNSVIREKLGRATDSYYALQTKVEQLEDALSRTLDQLLWHRNAYATYVQTGAVTAHPDVAAEVVR